MNYSQTLKDRLAESLDPEMQARYKKRKTDAVAAQSANYQGPEAVEALADGARTRALYSGLARAANKFGSVGGDGGQESGVPQSAKDFGEAEQGAFDTKQAAYGDAVKAEDAAIEGIGGLNEQSTRLAGTLDQAERTGVERGREDEKYGRESKMQGEEDDPDSGVSAAYRELASKFAPGVDFKGQSASSLKARLAPLESLYRVREQSDAKRAAAESQRMAMAASAAERAGARAEAKDSRDSDYARSRADKVTDRALEVSTPKPLGSEDKKRFDNARMATTAIEDMSKAVEAGDNTFSVIGDNNFTESRRRFQEALGRLQSGGAIGQDEEARFARMAPGAGDSKDMKQRKLQKIRDELNSIMGTLGKNPNQDVSGNGSAPPSSEETRVFNGKTYRKAPGGWVPQ